MEFTSVFIRRPVLATVVSLFILLVGAMSYQYLPVREFPNIYVTTVTIRTVFPGADAKLMEHFVTTPIENAIGGVDGIDTIQSSSSQDTSLVSVNFQLGHDIDVALNDINSRISAIRWKLPKEINDPIIEKVDPNAMPTMYIGFFSKHFSMAAITDYLIRVVQTQLETVLGVGEAKLFGEREYAMRIWLNAKLMAAHDVTVGEVASALESNNVRLPAGKIEADKQNFTLTLLGDLKTPAQFNDMIVKHKGDQVVRIKDIGVAKLGVKSDDFSVNINGDPGVVIGVIPKTKANPLEVADLVRQKLTLIKRLMPEGLDLKMLWDSSIFIEKSISEVKKTLVETALFVILVMFLFLGSIRILLIPSVTIPISLIGTFGLMWWMGFSVNTLTLLAMVLAIGMVVDDAIVVAENIYRYIEEGKRPMEAALVGAKQIRLAVIAMTLTLAAVYAPIGFTQGLSGVLFKEFAFSLAGAVIISGVVALTLSPMMCSKIMSKESLQRPLSKLSYRALEKLSSIYGRVLSGLLKIRWMLVAGGIGLIVMAGWLWVTLPKELGPVEDMGLILSIISGPASANLEFTEAQTKHLSKVFEQVPERLGYTIINGYPSGPNSALSFLVLKPWEQRERSVGQIIRSIMRPMLSMPGVLAFPINPYKLPGQLGTMPVELVLKSTGSHRVLYQAVQTLLAELHRIPFLSNIDTNLKIDKPAFNIAIRRDVAANLGVSVEAIANALNAALGEPLSNRFVMNSRSYYVITQLANRYQNYPEILKDLYVRTTSGKLVPLSTLVTIEEVTEPRSLEHFQQLNSANITASTFPPGLPLGVALEAVKETADRVLPKDVHYDFNNQSREFFSSKGKMLDIFIYALLFIYLTLSAQFESFRDPFIIITTVPLSTLGALLALKGIGGSINVYTNIGMITLIGLISKHGILMVEFANQLQSTGLSPYQAIVRAAIIRLRPILMTTFSMILGVLPLALATGAGAHSRQQMGWTILGGMSIGTLFSLFITPAVYVVLGSRKSSTEKVA